MAWELLLQKKPERKFKISLRKMGCLFVSNAGDAHWIAGENYELLIDEENKLVAIKESSSGHKTRRERGGAAFNIMPIVRYLGYKKIMSGGDIPAEFPEKGMIVIKMSDIKKMLR